MYYIVNSSAFYFCFRGFQHIAIDIKGTHNGISLLVSKTFSSKCGGGYGRCLRRGHGGLVAESVVRVKMFISLEF